LLRAEKVWCHVVLREREVNAVEKLGRLNLIPHSTRLSLQIAYLKVGNSMLKSLLKTKVRPEALPK